MGTATSGLKVLMGTIKNEKGAYKHLNGKAFPVDSISGKRVTLIIPHDCYDHIEISADFRLRNVVLDYK